LRGVEAHSIGDFQVAAIPHLRHVAALVRQPVVCETVEASGTVCPGAGRSHAPRCPPHWIPGQSQVGARSALSSVVILSSLKREPPWQAVGGGDAYESFGPSSLLASSVARPGFRMIFKWIVSREWETVPQYVRRKHDEKESIDCPCRRAGPGSDRLGHLGERAVVCGRRLRTVPRWLGHQPILYHPRRGGRRLRWGHHLRGQRKLQRHHLKLYGASCLSW